MPKLRFNFSGGIGRLRRYRHIMAVLAKYGFEEVTGTLRNKFAVHLRSSTIPKDVKQAAMGQSRPARVRLALEELGPTFVKLGQLLSTRPDLLPPEYIHELERLQDRVAPEKCEKVCAEVEKQLGDKLENIFAGFDTEPIAAGSIAQVHRATTHDGKSVVVKIRRPNIVEIIRSECRILEDIAGLLKTALFENEMIDPQQMVKEFNEAISQEVDLANERRNQMRFLQSFADDPTVHIPLVYEQYCSEGVLTMEYIEGVRPSSAEIIRQAGLDPKIIAQRGANFVLRQIFEFGFFHADPHPGNFFLLADNVLAPLDFGQVARLSSKDRILLTELVLSIVDNDAARMLQAIERADMIAEKTDAEKLLRDAEQMLDTYHNLPLKDIPLGKVITQTFELIRKHYIRPPAQFTLMLKSLMTIEAFAIALDPQFEIIQNLKPYARQFSLRYIDPKLVMKNARKAIRDVGDFATRLPEDLNAILSKFRQGKFQVRVHHEHLENLAKTLDKSSNRISFSLIIAALLVASSLLVPQDGMVLGLVSLQTLGIVGYIAAAVIGIWLLISIIRGRHL